MLSFFLDRSMVVKIPGNSLLPACEVGVSDIVFGVFFSELGGFGSVVAVFTAAVESCDILSALLIEIMVDLYVDLPLDLTVVGVLGLLEAAFATVFSAAGFFCSNCCLVRTWR